MFVLFSCGEGSGRKSSPAQTAAENKAAEQAPGSTADSAEKEELLRQAALEGRSQEVEKLLGEGIRVNAMDQEGRTALMYAAFNGHSSIILHLMDAGALVDRRDLMGRTALMFACTGPFPETVSILLDKGAEVNVVDSDEHFSPLMHAAAEGHLDVVKILIKAGANAALVDVDGDNAASFARQAGHLDVASYLESL